MFLQNQLTELLSFSVLFVVCSTSKIYVAIPLCLRNGLVWHRCEVASGLSPPTPPHCVKHYTLHLWHLSCLRDACPAWLGDPRELCLKTLYVGLSPSTSPFSVTWGQWIHSPLIHLPWKPLTVTSGLVPLAVQVLLEHDQFTVAFLGLPGSALVALGSSHQSCFAISCGTGSGLWKAQNSRLQNLLQMSWLPREGTDALYFHMAFSLVFDPVSVWCQLPLWG